MTRRHWASAAAILGAFLLAYLPDVGHGFVSDDYHWLLTAERFVHAPSVAGLFETTAFLRPVVTLSFAVNTTLFGHDPAGHGLTNLSLLLIDAALVYRLCRATHLSAAGALVAAGTWMFNFHGINMAVLWISGRTSLLLTMFALLTVTAMLKQKRWSAVVWCAAALLSKEEAVVLPFLVAAWVGMRAAWPLLVPLATYFLARVQTEAFWPYHAPDYYRFTTDIAVLGRNIVEYLDRGCTVFVIVGATVLLMSRAAVRLDAEMRPVLIRGLIWLIAGYAITVWVPVRSSLYAVFPSVGAALMLGSVADATFRRVAPAVRLRTAAVLLVLPFLLYPVYRARNVRWVELADVTHRVMRDLEAHGPAIRAGTAVKIIDDTSTRANVRNAFGGQLGYAIQVQFKTLVETDVTTDVENALSSGLVFRFRDGHLQ